MTDWRHAELRQCLGFVRASRAALAHGNLARSFRNHTLALRSLSLARAFGGPSAVTATAGLSRVVADLGDRIEDALRPRRRVEAVELVPDIFESLKVLQRNGVDVEDEVLLERARNLATGLTHRWVFTAAGDVSTACQQDLNPRVH
jgi:hypothetical protein